MREGTCPYAAFARMATAAVIALACLPRAAGAQPGSSHVTSSFTKDAVAIRPGGAVPMPGQVSVGQRIDYVLTAMAQSEPFSPAGSWTCCPRRALPSWTCCRRA